MNKIDSFNVNHVLLNPGIYVSRRDELNGFIITTFDLRMIKPNNGYFMSTTSIHTLEHLGATYLRNHNEYKDDIIYFGPMGCRTGFYLIMKGDLQSKDIKGLIVDMFNYIINFDGVIFGSDEFSCGNYLDLDLNSCKQDAVNYYEVVKEITEDLMIYK